jgi:hypothetical protein
MGKALVKGYSWREGSRHKVKPEVAAKEIERLAKQNGQRVDAAMVLESASDPTSPLHDEFTWDDTEAARQFRLEQARELVRSIRVTFETPERKEVTINVMTTVASLDHAQRSDYVPLAFAMSRTDLRQEVLARAIKELESFKQKYEHLSELAEVIDAIDGVSKKQKD